VDTKTLTVEAYANEYSDPDRVLSGVLYAAPLLTCPPDSTSEEECLRFFAEVADAFVMPLPGDDGGTVEVCFTGPVALPFGALVYIDNAGYMQVEGPPSGEFVQCSECHWFSNYGTEGNAAGGAAVAAGNPLYLVGPPATSADAPDSGDLTVAANFNSTTGLASGNITLPWAARVLVLWKVGLAPDTDVTSNSAKRPHFNYHWGMFENSVQISADVNDAEGSHYMACTGTGSLVRTLAAGNYTFSIQYVTGSNEEVPLVDRSSITVLAVRQVALVP
jgi:hypothetical protein